MEPFARVSCYESVNICGESGQNLSFFRRATVSELAHGVRPQQHVRPLHHDRKGLLFIYSSFYYYYNLRFILYCSLFYCFTVLGSKRQVMSSHTASAHSSTLAPCTSYKLGYKGFLGAMFAVMRKFMEPSGTNPSTFVAKVVVSGESGQHFR